MVVGMADLFLHRQLVKHCLLFFSTDLVLILLTGRQLRHRSVNVLDLIAFPATCNSVGLQDARHRAYVSVISRFI